MRVSRYVLALLVGIFAVTAASAQNGGIRVRVFDGTDKTPMIGAIVALSNTQKLIADTSQLTDANGVAYFPVLRAGPGYVVEAFADGYGRVRIEARVRISEVQDLPIYLNPQQQEVVTVVGRKGSVDLESTTTSTKYGQEFLGDLPIAGRFYQNALTLAPGVQDADGDGNPNVHGARDRDFKATVGGVSNQDPLSGKWLSYVNSDSIEEIEVVTAGAGAEFGRAQGGFAQVIQKQGSNDREGVFSFLYRSSKLDGDGATNIPAEFLPAFSTVQPALSLTGPILRDKLWYRFNYEMLRVDEPVVLSGSSAAVVKNRLAVYDGQATWQMSPKNKMSLQYRNDPLTIENEGVSSFTPVESSRRRERGSPTWTVRWTAPYSPKLVLDSLVAYQDFEQDIEPTLRGVPNRCAVGLPVIQRSQCFNIETSEVSGSSSLEYHDARQRLTLSSQGEWFAGRWLGMEHQVKFGLNAENERFFRRQVQRPDSNFRIVRPSGGEDPQDPNAEPELDLVGIINVTFGIPEESSARATGTNWSVYFQDTIRPINNLTVNVVARLNREEINADGFEQFDPQTEVDGFLRNSAADPARSVQYFQEGFTAYEGLNSYAANVNAYLGIPASLNPSGIGAAFFARTRRASNINITRTNFEPRLSAKWDPWNDGKTSFFATAGRYYDKIFLQVPLVESEPVTTSVTFDLKPVPGSGGQWRVENSSIPLNPALNTSMVDRNLRTPYKDEFTLGFEREILPETVVRVKYIRSRFRDQFQDININKNIGDFGRCSLQSVPREPWIVTSEGSGQELFDPHTGETYIDTDPGVGDGRVDDCAGKIVGLAADSESEFGRARLTYRPDGIADLYILNPAWGDIYLVGNFNSQKYSAVEVQLQRRLYKNWEMEASYTWSRAIGDAEDFQLALGDDRSTLADERGYLSYDQRHVVKLNATTLTPWGVRFGSRITWQSGLPYSILRRDFSFATTPPTYSSYSPPDPPIRTTYVTGQRNDQRNRPSWNFDLKASKDFSLPRGMNGQVSAEVFNLLNDDTYSVYNDFLDYGQQVNGRNEGQRRFGRRFQLGMRLSF